MHPATAQKVIDTLIKYGEKTGSPFYTEIMDEAEDRWLTLASLWSHAEHRNFWFLRDRETAKQLLPGITGYQEIIANLRLASSDEGYGSW